MRPVIVYHTFKRPADRVWTALTNADEMKKWYFTVHDFVLEEGHVFTFYESETTRQYLHRCEIIKVIPQKLFEHTWEHPSQSKGISTVKWELQPQGDNATLLTLTHSGLENFADAGDEFKSENYETGWNEILKTSLRNYLYGIEKLVFEIDINAPGEKVWQLLWGKESYSQWTKAFMEGSYYEGDLEQGNRVHLLAPSGEGMYSDIIFLKQNEQLIFKHIGYLKDKKEIPVDAETEIWTGSLESYQLTETTTGTHLKVEVDNQVEYRDYMNKTFPLVLQELKKMAEEK